jgi:uncharacterized protein
MQFIPIVEKFSTIPDKVGMQLIGPDYSENAKVSDWSVEPEKFGDFLCAIFDKWVRQDVGQSYVQIFDVALEAWYGMEPGLCVFKEKCGKAMAIEHNGDLYSCDHYVYSDYKLGNIMENPIVSLVENTQQVKFGNDKFNSLPQYCENCDFRFICNGECPKHRFIETPDGEYGLNYLCAGYKKFFNHVDPYMRFMANELKNGRPPANVIGWVREKDKGFPSLKLSPNDRCPCDSGKNLKKCCGRATK